MLGPLLNLASRAASLAGYSGIIINNHLEGRQEIRSQVDTLARSFDFIGLDELQAAMTHRRRRPFCLFTFDDGKQIQVEAAAELESLGIPAVIYVVTASMESSEPLWFDKLRALRESSGFSLPPELQREAVKKRPLVEIKPLVDKACAAYGCCPEPDDPRSRAFDWQTARDLHRRGFVVGAHTVDHAILTNETPEEAQRQIRLSLDTVSKQLGCPCTTFAFPNGNYNEMLIEYAKTCGAQMLMTTDPRWVRRRDSLSCLPRIQISHGATVDVCRAKIIAALPGFVLKNPDGTGRAYAKQRRR